MYVWGYVNNQVLASDVSLLLTTTLPAAVYSLPTSRDEDLRIARINLLVRCVNSVVDRRVWSMHQIQSCVGYKT